ncbi:hypothetical protein [Leptolyngbya sp. FACHB-1515]|uniref:hypothetical protein n=1 Tax=Leptolyngbya sp. FACHB-1515 TaxID=2933931 RepID=UPI00329A49A8
MGKPQKQLRQKQIQLFLKFKVELNYFKSNALLQLKNAASTEAIRASRRKFNSSFFFVIKTGGWDGFGVISAEGHLK